MAVPRWRSEHVPGDSGEEGAARTSVHAVVVAVSFCLDRKALAALLATQADLRVVAEAAWAEAAVEGCRAWPGSLLLVDTSVVIRRGGDALVWLREQLPRIRILALARDAGQRCATGDDLGPAPHARFPCCAPHDCLGLAILQGADAVVRRCAPPSELFRALRSTAAGGVGLGWGPTRRMLACALARGRSGPERTLTARERGVAGRIGTGLSNKEIAGELGIGVPTVKKHVGQILAKLGLHDRLQIGLLVARHPDWFGELRPRRYGVESCSPPS